MLMNKKAKDILLFLLLTIFIFVVYKCPFKFFLGIPCPGCGMSRAFLCLLRFDIRGAFHYHPLFPIVIIVGIYLVCKWLGIYSMSEKAQTVWLVILAIIFFATYFFRMYMGTLMTSVG